MPDSSGYWIATIDADGVLVGFDKSCASEGVAVPVDCDLDPGKYRWDAAAERWEPVMVAHPKPLPEPPDMLVAIALGIRAFGKTVQLPAYTLEWLKGFERYPDDWSR